VPVQNTRVAKDYSRTAFVILMAALSIVIGGMVWTWRIAQTSNRLYHRLAHLQEATATLSGAASEKPQ